MSKKSLASVLRSWVARGNRIPAARPGAKLRLEEVEQRVVPATTPPVTASAALAVPNTGTAFAPQVVADPTNPNSLAMVAAKADGILVQISFDGGTSWTVLRNTSPVPNGDPSGGKLLDPNLPINTGVPQINRSYTNVSAPTIAFSRGTLAVGQGPTENPRFGSIYVAYLEHNLAMTSGALVVERFDIDRQAQGPAAATPDGLIGANGQYDLDRARDWDDTPATPGSERWRRANGSNNRGAVLYQWVDDGNVVNRPLNPYIAVDTNLPTFTDPSTLETVTDPFAGNTTTSTGPDTQSVRTSGGETVFVAWNMQSSAPTVNNNGNQPLPGTLNFTPNAIMMAVGRLDTLATIDRPDPNAPPGANNLRQPAFLFSTPVPVNDGNAGTDTFPGGGHFLWGNNVNTGGAAPIVKFTPASLNDNGSATPGRLSVVWSTTGSQIAQSTTDLGAGPASASYTFRSNDLDAASGLILDANDDPDDFDTARTTTFDIPVSFLPFLGPGGFTSVDDLDVTIALSHPNLNHLQIVLVAPNGTRIVLVRNRTQGDNNPVPNGTFGLGGADLGVAQGIQGSFAQGNARPGNPVGTVFSQEAARQVHDTSNPGNYIGSYRPETGLGGNGNTLADLYGLTPADFGANAIWQLEVTDVRDDRLTFNNAPTRPVQFLRFWSLTFTSRVDNDNAGGRSGSDRFVTNGGAAAPVGVLPNRISTTGFGAVQTYGNLPPVSPVFGVGPSVSVAYDNSLGSFSRFAGRMYVAYTGGGGTNTNVFLIRSDDNGATWSTPVQVNDDSAFDNFSEGRRSQFQPSVTVDPATGTVVVMWYDARIDASNSRVSTFVATSIDGGVTFSVNAPVNAKKFAIDAITGARVELEPIPSNLNGLTTFNAGAFQYGGPGIRQSVVAFGGVIKPFWTGNLNAAGSSIFTATVRTAAGPRVLESDMGAVTELSLDGAFQNGGSVSLRDEDGFATTIVDAFGNTRSTYNDTFTPDGTRQMDGVRVVFDRPVYFGTSATAPDGTLVPGLNNSEGFTVDDIQVRFRGPTGALSTATQGALIPLQGVRPIGGFSVDGFYFATAFFVQFQTPQSAVGTYSYSVGPGVFDRLRSRTTAVFSPTDTPLTLEDPGTVESTIVIPPLTGSPTVQNLQIGLNISHTWLSDLIVTLIAPDGTEVILVNQEGGSNDNIINMRLADGGIPSDPFTGYPITTPFNNFNGVYAPFEPLSVLNGLPISGTWRLRIDDVFATDTGTLNSWTLTFRDAAGNPVAIQRDGNGMDQDADASQLEPANDVYSAPGSLAGAPFAGPFDSNTKPVVLPGAHVVRTYAGGQFATATSAVVSSFSSSFLTVTLDREVDVNTLTLAGVVSVVGPNGVVTPTSIFPSNTVNGGAKEFFLGFNSPLPAGNYRVTLNNTIYVVDDTVLNGTANEVYVRFDRDINPASFTPANVLRVTGPTGNLSLAGVTVTPVNEARVPLANATAARLFRVTFEQPERVVVQPTAFTTIPITLTAVPTARPLTIGDVLSVVGPSGPVSLAGATLTGSGTSYTLTFGTIQLGGRYVVNLRPTPNTVPVSQGATFSALPFTLAAAPTTGQLTIADIASLTGPGGAVSLTGASLTVTSPTSYILNLAASQTSGLYTIGLNPAVLRGVGGVQLSGPYALEFGSNPAEPNAALAAIRGVDRPQFVTPQAAAFTSLVIPVSSVNGTLTLADVVRVTGPNGLVSLAGASLSGPAAPTAGDPPGTTARYTITFGGSLSAGQYVVDFAAPQAAVDHNPAVVSNFIDVTFAALDRALTLSDIVRVSGPGGEFTPTALTQLSGTTYRLSFASNVPTGRYVVDVNPAAARNIRIAGSGLAVDNNFNAGLDLLTGRAPAGASVSPRTFPTATGPVAITPATLNNDGGTPSDPRDDRVTPTVAEMPIVVTEDFVITQDTIQRVQVLMNISIPNVWTLDIELVPPSTTGVGPILLYRGADDRPANSAAGARGGSNFINTLLVDRVGDPNYPSILDGLAPFTPGSGFGYTPQNPLSVLVNPANPVSARGTWVLRVTNRGTNQTFTGGNPPDAGQINNWTLTLPRAEPGTGLGERAADRFQVGFKVYTQDPTNELSRDAWTPVGPASANETATSGRVTAIAVDPSDPSGNTVYVTGASGGVWKTTNFLTNDIDGPHYVPLTDFGPTSAINIQSIALFPRNNDPSQTIVFALTGEGNTLGSGGAPGLTSAGVGILRSTDGGKTWSVLDSTNNASTDPGAAPGTVGKVSDPGRNRLFVGASGFKVVVDPVLSPEGGVIVYMALSGSGTQNGVWRSRDGGLTWARVRAGNATDVILAAGSGNVVGSVTAPTVGNLQRLYASFRGEGVFQTDSAPSAAGMSLIGGNGSGVLPNVRDLTVPTPLGTGVPVGVVNNPSPNGVPGGRIAIATPALTSDPVRNFFYKDWLYAVVVDAQGRLVGLYQTKDAGSTTPNWTQVRIPVFQSGQFTGFPSNNETLPTYDVFNDGLFGQGNYDIALTVDPLNPAVLYLGGLGGSGLLSPVNGSIKLDLTAIKDTQNFTNFNNSDFVAAGGANNQAATIGGLSPRVNAGNGGVGRLVRGFSNNTYSTDFINATRDPNNPFTTNSTLRVANVGSMVNDGTDIKWQPFNDILAVGDLRTEEFDNERLSATDIHSIVPFIDPTTGNTRFIYGTDQGVFTGVDRGDGLLGDALGFERLVTGSRNGNLQLTQFYSGAVQPSQLAADVAGALFYGMAQDNGFLVADARALSEGNTNWRGPSGDGVWVEVDPTGSGRAFQYRSPINFGFDNYTSGLPQEFIREFVPGADHEFGGGIPRTNGLIQPGDFQPLGGQWPTSGGVPFAMNPVNPNALVIQSNAGRVFRSTTGGVSWVEIASPGTLGAGGPAAQAFGAADPNNPTLANNFIYVGTSTGQMYVTTTGGTTWTDITANLLAVDGSPVRKIVPNPAAGSREVYVVTNFGVYYKADGSVAGAWTEITGGLYNVTRSAFGDAQDQVPVLPTAGRSINTLAVDWRFNNPITGNPNAPATAPDLYVGGVGGVFKSSDFGATWRLFPSMAAEGSGEDGGYLPNVEVTDLDLSIGDINQTSGRYEPGGLNLLLASTYGRGSWAIRLSSDLPPESFVSGPIVLSVSIPTQPVPGTISVIEVQFTGPVDPATLTPENFRLQILDGSGNPTGDVQILSVGPSSAVGAVNRYAVTFQGQTVSSTQQYRLTVGNDATGVGVPSITDPAGNRMNQDGDTTNGEAVVDQFVRQIVLDGVSSGLTVTTSPATLTAGTVGTVRIEQRRADGSLETTANATLTLSTTGGRVILDQNGNPLTTVQLVNGVVQFQIQMRTAGTYPIQVASNAPGVNPTGFTTVVTAAAAAGVTLSPPNPTASAPGQVVFTVSFTDQFGNPTDYTGTATVTYAGAAVGSTSPTTVNVTPTNNTFTVTTQQAGTVGVTVSLPRPAGAPPGGNLTATATITVSPGAATTVAVTPVGSWPFVANAPFAVTVRVTDSNGNLVSSVNGPVTVNLGTANGTVSPATVTMTNGVATFSATYTAAGTFTITATVPGGTTGASAPITVNAQPPRPSPTQTLSGTFAAATGVDGSPVVSVFNANGSPLTSLNPFPPGFGGEVDAGSPGFTGGIRMAVADVTGDGVADYVVGSGPTITATVLVIDGTNNRTILTLRPFETFTGGVFVNAGDVDGDGIADIVMTPDQGGGPRVTIVRGGNFRQLANFLGIDDANFRGGARAALGDVNGDGFADLVVSAGFGGGPRISIYDGAALRQGTRLNVIGDFFLFEPALRNGAFVAVGDVNGDGLADIIGGAGPGGGPRVLILDSATMLGQGVATALATPLFNSFLGDINNRGGVRVAAKNLDGDRFADILIGAGEGGGSRVEAYAGANFGLLQSFDLLPGYTGGVFVG